MEFYPRWWRPSCGTRRCYPAHDPPPDRCGESAASCARDNLSGSIESDPYPCSDLGSGTQEPDVSRAIRRSRFPSSGPIVSRSPDRCPRSPIDHTAHQVDEKECNGGVDRSLCRWGVLPYRSSPSVFDPGDHSWLRPTTEGGECRICRRQLE